MNYFRLLSLAALTAASFLFAGAESKAAVITLPSTANSLQGNSFTVPTVPGLTFAFQQVLATGSADPTLVVVAALSPPGTTQAGAAAPFGFQLAGAGMQAAAGQTGDLLLNFSVTSPLPITQVILFANGGASGNGAVLVTEVVTNPNGGAVIGQATIASGTVTINLSEALTTIHISKDIAFTGGTQQGGSASYSDIRQTFTTVVPEPASLVLLGCGLVGVVGLNKLRRMKSNA